MNNIPVLGIDVSKDKLDCALWVEGKYKSKVVANNSQGFTDLLNWLHKWHVGSPHACIEATGVYWEASAEFLAAHDMQVSVVNPAQIKAFGGLRLVRTKTDAVDARLIAEFCLRMTPEAWQPPSPGEQALRALVQRLDALQGMHTQESNRLGVAREAVRNGIADHLAWLDKEIEALTKQIRDHINGDTDLKRISNESVICSTAFPVSGSAPSRLSWHLALIRIISPARGNVSPLPGLTPGSINRGAV